MRGCKIGKENVIVLYYEYQLLSITLFKIILIIICGKSTITNNKNIKLILLILK
jgi:hypothetical protein